MGRKHGSSFLGTPWPKNLPRKQRPKQALASPTMSLEDAERGQRRKCKRTAAEANLSVQMSLPEKARDRGSAQPSHHRLVAGRTLARLQHLCSMHFLYTPQEFKEEIAARPGITAKLGEQLVYIIGRYGFRHQIRLDVLPMHPSPGIKNRWTCNKSEVQTCNEQELTKIGDTTVRQWQKLKQRRLIALEDRNMKCSDLHLFFLYKNIHKQNRRKQSLLQCKNMHKFITFFCTFQWHNKMQKTSYVVLSYTWANIQIESRKQIVPLYHAQMLWLCRENMRGHHPAQVLMPHSWTVSILRNGNMFTAWNLRQRWSIAVWMEQILANRFIHVQTTQKHHAFCLISPYLRFWTWEAGSVDSAPKTSASWTKTSQEPSQRHCAAAHPNRKMYGLQSYSSSRLSWSFLNS